MIQEFELTNSISLLYQEKHFYIKDTNIKDTNDKVIIKKISDKLDTLLKVSIIDYLKEKCVKYYTTEQLAIITLTIFTNKELENTCFNNSVNKFTIQNILINKVNKTITNLLYGITLNQDNKKTYYIKDTFVNIANKIQL
jgi:hypothetical protein